MKRLLLIGSLLFFSGLLRAQKNMLVTKNAAAYKTSSTELTNKVNAILGKCSANKSVEFVNIDMSKIAASKELTMQFGDYNEYEVVKENVNVRNINSFGFFGKNKDGDGTVQLSFLDDDIQGTIHKGNQVYRIETVGPKEYAIVLLDESKFKPEVEIPLVKPPSQPVPNSSSAGVATSSAANNAYTPGSTLSQSSATAMQSPSCKMRVLVLWTPAARVNTSNIQNLIYLAVDETNQAFVNSRIDYQVELAYAKETDYSESGNNNINLDRFYNPTDQYMDEVFGLRTKYAADFCVLIVDGSAGVGFLNNYASLSTARAEAFSVVGVHSATGYYQFAHEMAHNVGCRHNWGEDNRPPLHAHGYLSRQRTWFTIMSYPANQNDVRIPYFSNPLVSYNGEPTGNDTCNNAWVWNENAQTFIGVSQPPNDFVFRGSDLLGRGFADVVAKNTIVTNNNDNIGSAAFSSFGLNLRAGNSVTLNPGFSFAANSNRTASRLYVNIENITDCGTLPPAAKVLVSDLSSDQPDANKNDIGLNIFPNPTNAVLNGTYNIAAASTVTISLVDIFGKNLKTIQSGKRMDRGNYNFTTKVADLAKGVYFLVLNVGGSKTVKKVVVN